MIYIYIDIYRTNVLAQIRIELKLMRLLHSYAYLHTLTTTAV